MKASSHLSCLCTPNALAASDPPIVIGGQSRGAFRRAVRRGQGWYGFLQDLEATRRALAGLEEAAKEVERPAGLAPLEISITPPPGLDLDMARRYEDLGVHRLIPLSLVRSGEEVVEFVQHTGVALAAIMTAPA